MSPSKRIGVSFLCWIFFSCVILSSGLHAQDSLANKPLQFSAYVEVYYCYDLGNPSSHERPPFFYNFNRQNEVNLNLGIIKASYQTQRLRANLAFMAGTYAQYNMASEQGLLKNMNEANIGLRISKQHNIWVDAGILPSHIGFESAIGKDCWTLTRSIVSDNSPYYEAGVKLGYTTKNEKLYLAALYLNGWQRIQRVPGNQTPCFGSQITYKPNSNILVHYSNFVGSDLPDSLREWRIYNNIHTVLQLTEKFGMTLGIDYGRQQIKKDTNVYNVWYAPIIILQYKPISKIQLAARVEYYKDENEVIIKTGTVNGFQTMGYSVNCDYLISKNAMWRIEGRMLNSMDKIFILNNAPSSMNYFFTTSLAISF